MARPKTVLTKRIQKTLVSRYNKGAGLVELAGYAEVSIPVVRRHLREAGVKIRKQGRPVVKKARRRSRAPAIK